MSIHSRIRKLRLATDLTQRDVAIACDAAISTVCHWETGRSLPRTARMRRLARVLGTTVAALYGEQKAAA